MTVQDQVVQVARTSKTYLGGNALCLLLSENAHPALSLGILFLMKVILEMRWRQNSTSLNS
jgi:hypothetical protein